MAFDIKNKGLIKLNIGCGLNAPLGWINIDTSITARLSKVKRLYKVLCKIGKIEPIEWPKNIKIVDVRKGIPYGNNSIKAIFSSHMLEHVNFEEANFIFRECHRCLCEGGAMRIIVPDLFQISKIYIENILNDPKGKHSHDFLRNLKDESHKGVRKVFYKMFSHSKHLYMYDEWSLRELFEQNGYKNVQRMNYGRSLISDIEKVEDKGRYKTSICLEGIK